MSKIQFTEIFCMYVFVWVKNTRWPPQQDKKENRTTWENLAYSLKPLNNLKSCWPHCFLGNSAKIQFFMVIEFQDDCHRRTYLCQWIYYWIINLLNTNSTWIIRWASSFIFSYFMKYIWFYSIFFSFLFFQRSMENPLVNNLKLKQPPQVQCPMQLLVQVDNWPMDI